MTDQINELSKSTLGSYIKKATKSATKASGEASKHGERYMNSDAGSEKERNSWEAGEKNITKTKKRINGIFKATDKLTKEESENMTDETIDETTAIDSLAPKSNYSEDPKSKIEYIKNVIGALASMEKEDLSKWYNDTIAQVGSDHFSKALADKSESNKDTLNPKPSDAQPVTRKPKVEMPKLSVKEDFDEIFTGEDLSEEFKEKASTLFEAAVMAKIIAETARLEEAFEEAYEVSLEEEINALEEDLTEKINNYLEYAVSEFIKENVLQALRIYFLNIISIFLKIK